jgi:tetratricopeptide (TPR) repeat protein
MPPSKLDDALEQYESKLKEFQTHELVSESQILDILLTRDNLQKALAISKAQVSNDSLVKVLELDKALKERMQSITWVNELDYWRDSLGRSDNHWWWSSKNFKKLPPTNTKDLFLKVLTFSCLIPALALIVDISSRFILGGPGVFGTGAVIINSFLALVASKGTLTDAGGIVDNLVTNLRIPEKRQQLFKFGLVFLLLSAFVFIYRSLPKIADIYYQNGEENYEQRQLSNAEANFSRAIRLDPNNMRAHNKLGELYEDLQRFEDAQAEYQIAMQGGLISGYSNLARSYILKGNTDNQAENEESYVVAIRFLTPAYNLINEKSGQEVESEELYEFYVSFGWAYFKLGDSALPNANDFDKVQQHLDKAQFHLEQAIALESQLVSDPTNEAPAAAHCLLAQVLDIYPANGIDATEQDAKQEWEKCLRLTYRRVPRPYEARWYMMAQNSSQDQ